MPRLWAEPTMPRRWVDGVRRALLAHRGKTQEAWRTLDAYVSSWWHLFYFDVVPMELVVERTLTQPLTPEREEKIPRAPPRGTKPRDDVGFAISSTGRLRALAFADDHERQTKEVGARPAAPRARSTRASLVLADPAE